jgi:hypothetical protein
MALAPFFDRTYGAVGGHLAVSRESLTGLLNDVVVGIRCGDKLSQNDVWIAEFLTNLAARFYPRLAFTGPDDIVGRLTRIAVWINPQIDIETNSPGHTSIRIGPGSDDSTMFPSAGGWVAQTAHAAGERQGPANPYSSAASAALAAAEMFRRVVCKGEAEPDSAVSLLDLSPDAGASYELNPTDIDDLLFVGLGAVGNSALWTMARDHTLSGTISLVDGETLALSNVQRYVLAGTDDDGALKVALGERALMDSSIKSKPVASTLAGFIASKAADLKVPLLAVSVDNVAGRRAAQALLPKILVNGWTGDQALGASWHVFSRDAACVACLYHPQGKGLSATEQAAKAFGLSPMRVAELWVSGQPLSSDDMNTVARALGVKLETLDPWRQKSIDKLYTDIGCGAVPLDVTGLGKIETVPLAHQSALAGVLMAAELVKRCNPELASVSQQEPLVSWDNILKGPQKIRAKFRPREAGCICGDKDYQNVYAELWERA